MNLFLALCLGATGSTICEDNNAELCVAPVAQGEACPFSGELLTYKLALDLKQKANRCEFQLGEQKKADAADFALQVKTAQTLRMGDQKQFAATMDNCRKQLQQQQGLIDRCEPPWWQKPAFVIPVTFVATSLATTYLVLQVTR